MDITEVRIKLTEDSDDRLQAFCSITFDDCFVVRDLKIIEGTNGPFVAMPSRKLTSHCGRCGSKNHLRANYCNQCGGKLQSDRAPRDSEGRAELYADIAHPINSPCREAIQEKVITAYRQELELAKQPGYVSRYDEDYEDDFSAADLPEESSRSAAAPFVQPGSPTDEAASPATSPAGAGSGQMQRADPGSPPTEVPSPHLVAPPTASPGGPSTPHSGLRKKPGFGAGILDD